MSSFSLCPCGRETAYADCCGAIHSGARQAITAEDLMRSRYSAFAIGKAAYLLHSWSPGSRPETPRLSEDRTWTGLTIQETTGGGPFDQTGTVRFRARYDTSSGSGVLAEKSLFGRTNGRWVYVGPAPD
ncbi:MAG: YchJ family protein [Acidimicrobiales bacterium]